jgi:hypothetical protein
MIITELAFITALMSSPTPIPILEADSVVITDTMLWPLMSKVISVEIGPFLMLVTLPFNWLRAETCKINTSKKVQSPIILTNTQYNTRH